MLITTMQGGTMTNSPSIVPSETELRQWESLIFNGQEDVSTVLTQAFQAGADQELEACCLLLDKFPHDGPMLHDARRPKPPSLKEQALLQLDTLNADLAMHGRGCDLSQIRRALEALPND